MRIHILGICGTFMAGIAQLATQAGHEVSGSDINVYPPMSTQLQMLGIDIKPGYEPAHIDPNIDIVIVGNVIRRGNALMEFILDNNIPYISGPGWLAENILKHRWVLAVSGTHGKTTTTSLLSWILTYAGKSPGFLVGGVPENFGVSAQIGQGPFFVIEADEYDSAFFDKRAKFLHYRPKTLILNNVEFDHADIYPDLAAIKQQFHFLIRTVPNNGLLIRNGMDENIKEILQKGCWTPDQTWGGQNADWQARLKQPDGSCFEVFFNGVLMGEVEWNLLGQHNVHNALAAIAGAHHAGVSAEIAIKSLKDFKNIKRRLEIKGKVNGVTVYDDFAHHPTAIATTLAGLRAKVGDEKIVAVLEFGSYTMRTGVHKDSLKAALTAANSVICKRPEEVGWDLDSVLKGFSQPTAIYDTVDSLVDNLVKQLHSGDHVVIMSNSGFGGIHQKLLTALEVSPW